MFDSVPSVSSSSEKLVGLRPPPAVKEKSCASLGCAFFTTVTLPLASRTILAGALLGFTRALGEFGATIVVAGSIPGRTRTLAVGIYTYTETGQDARAAALLAVSVTLAFGAALIANRLAHVD